jgi:hypothetical protein
MVGNLVFQEYMIYVSGLVAGKNLFYVLGAVVCVNDFCLPLAGEMLEALD